MRQLLFVLIIVAFGTVATSSEDLKDARLRTQAVHVSSILSQTAIALLAAGDLLNNNEQTDGAVIEATLSRYANQVEGLRSILVVGDGGNFDGTALQVTVVDGTTYQVTINVTSFTDANQIDLAIGTTEHDDN